jgi:hypothetical protein
MRRLEGSDLREWSTERHNRYVPGHMVPESALTNRNQSDDLHNLQKEWIHAPRCRPIWSIGRVCRGGTGSGLDYFMSDFPVEQQRKWDHGEDWPLCVELVAAVPEMETALMNSNLQTDT